MKSMLVAGLAALVSVVAIAAFAATLYANLEEGREWDAFVQLHHCQMVGEKNDAGLTFISDKTGYLCDDGITYWRSH